MSSKTRNAIEQRISCRKIKVHLNRDQEEHGYNLINKIRFDFLDLLNKVKSNDYAEPPRSKNGSTRQLNEDEVALVGNFFTSSSQSNEYLYKYTFISLLYIPLLYIPIIRFESSNTFSLFAVINDVV